ncbi:MAG: STAS/SEC14 domain-containing protein [Anaerolineae bacterium]|jgi:methionine synthase II (cobalamin-independent)|nr:STAS/SEC14 domain-containing protein [Anaerolineae bacterium]
MPYQVQWEIPESILRVRLWGHVTLEDFIAINHLINEAIAMLTPETQVSLLVDVNEAHSVPQTFNDLKASQTYARASNSRIKYILVVCGNNKLLRLMMLLIFNLARPSLQFFDTPVQALSFMSIVNRART